MNVINQGFKYLGDHFDSVGFSGIFAFIGGLFIKIVFSWIQKKILEKRKAIEDFRDEVETIKIRQEGQESFVKTLQDHEIRLSTVETIVNHKFDEIMECQYEERRKANIPVKVERRIKKRKYPKTMKTDVKND